MNKTGHKKIYVGGWFQRTVLHLRETFNFLKNSSSPLSALSSRKLSKFRKSLRIKDVHMEIDELTYVEFSTDFDVDVKIFEDGLVVLSKNVKKLVGKDLKELTSYYEDILSPALNYLFSLGMPLPKELIGAKIVCPYFIVLNNTKEGVALNFLKKFNEEKHFQIKTKEFEIYRGNKLYIINNISEKKASIERFVQEQIFIREFVSQMHRYLNLHRIVWEKIDNLKERGLVKGRDVEGFKDQIGSYTRKVNLIEARIHQMNISVQTRELLAYSDKNFSRLLKVLEFKYSALSSTLKYIKEIWRTTKDYAKSTQGVLEEIESESTAHSIQNLSVITSIGVFASLLNLWSRGTPTLNFFGFIYLIVLAIAGYVTNKIITRISMDKSYKIKNIKFPKGK